jgi:hypothetical protein
MESLDPAAGAYVPAAGDVVLFPRAPLAENQTRPYMISTVYENGDVSFWCHGTGDSKHHFIVAVEKLHGIGMVKRSG